MSAFRYRPEVDGLRAISVIAVILFHADFGCPGGFVGVDVFFVISGFLITSLILNDFAQKTFSLKNFWARRIRRILPAASLMVVTVLAAGYLLLLPEDLMALGNSTLAQSLFGSNIYFWRNGGYFARNSETEPLLHTWSLAVEEQFYLFYPLLIVLLQRYSRRWFGATLFVLTTISFVLSAYAVYRSPSATFYLLPTRAWEMLAGGLVALSGESKRPRYVSEVVAWCSLAAIGLAVFLMNHETVFPGAMALVPVLGASAFIWANTGESTSAGRLLSLRPLVFVGLISYSLYLWHWPLFAYLRYIVDSAEPTVVQRAAALLASCLFAVLAWYFVEEPIRRRKILATTPGLLASTGVSFVTLLAVAGLILQRDGFPGRIPSSWRIAASTRQNPGTELGTEDLPVLGDLERIHEPTFVVWGDSHANVAVPQFDFAAKQLGISGLSAAKGGRPPIPGASISWDPEIARWNTDILEIIKTRKIPHVFLVARWSQFIEGATDYDRLNERGLTVPLLRCSTVDKPTLESAEICFKEGLHRLIQDLKGTGCKIWIIKQVPDQNYDILRRSFLEYQGIRISTKMSPVTSESFEARQRRIDAIFSKLASEDVQLIDLSSKLFDRDGTAIVSTDGIPLYRDSHHLSPPGAELTIRPIVTEILNSIVSKTKTEAVRNTDGESPQHPAGSE